MQKKISNIKLFILLGITFLILFALNVGIGSVKISLLEIWQVFFHKSMVPISTHSIIIDYRLPQAITAVLAGIGLSVAGLLMQSFFRNPLAGPSLLGISSGASLGVAFLIMISGSSAFFSSSVLGSVSVAIAALLGAFSILLIILFLNNILRNAIALLIVGIMIGYFVSAIIGFLEFQSMKEDLQAFVFWGLGSFSNVGKTQMYIFVIVVVIGFVIALYLTKALNALLLGEEYATNIGVNVKNAGLMIILSAGLLTAIVSAYCGPIAFIGIAVPHLGRNLFVSSNHKILLPAVVLLGACIALCCNFIARLPGFDAILPINTVTSAFGAPLVIWLIIKRSKSKISI